MDRQNDEGGATNSKRTKGFPGPPGYLFDQPRQRKKEYWQCIKLVAPTMEAKPWKASEAIFAWCTICNCKVSWKLGEINPVKNHMESKHKWLLWGETTNEKDLRGSSTMTGLFSPKQQRNVITTANEALDEALNVKEPTTSMNGLTTAKNHQAWYEVFQRNSLNDGGRQKKNPCWGFFEEFEGKKSWFYCVVCFAKEPEFNSDLKRRTAGVLNYDKSNTTVFKNHCKSKHSLALFNFSSYLKKKRETEHTDEQAFPKKSKKSLSEVTSSEITKLFTSQGKPYRKKSIKQISYERSLCVLTAEPLIPLSLCEMPAYRKHVRLLDPRILPVSLKRLTQQLLPDFFAEQKQNMIDELQQVTCVALNFDIWTTKKTEEIFLLNANCCKKNIHLGMPFSSGGKDGKRFSSAVKDCLDEFYVSRKVVSLTQDDGGNLSTCERALDENVDNSEVFTPKQPIFEQECTAHVLHCACKATVINVESDDKLINVEKTRTRLQACITWTKNSHEGQKFLSDAQSHCNLPCQRLPTLEKIQFAYLIVAFGCLLKNRAAIDYLYGEKPEMSHALRERKPSWQDWEVAKMTVTTLRSMVGSVVLTQARTDKRLLSDAIDNLITVYIGCLEGSETVIEAVAEQCTCIKNAHDHSEESCLFAQNLEQVTKKMCLAIKEKLKAHIQPFLDVDCPKNKAHMFFALLLDPRFLQMKSLLKLHAAENINSYTYFSHMTEKLFDYVIAADNKKNFKAQSSATDVADTDYILPDIFQMLPNADDFEGTRARARHEFGVYKQLVAQHFLSGKGMESGEVVDWFIVNKSKIPMISHFASIVHIIPPSQIENERDFSSTGEIARAKRASLTAENLAMSVFINKNNGLQSSENSNEAKNIFEGDFGDMQEDVDEVEEFMRENG